MQQQAQVNQRVADFLVVVVVVVVLTTKPSDSSGSPL
jgi:hypothetical protein